MAEIKVERKGVPWWAWLLLAILAVLLIWWAVEAFSDDDADEEMARPATDTAVVDTAPAAPLTSPDGAAGGAITDIGAVLDASDPTALVGREVRLEDVRVLEMVGDATFWVGRGANDRMFVILDEQTPSPPPGVEGRVNVQAGQTVDLVGAVRASGDLPAGDVLDQTGRSAAGEGPVYIWAQSATVATRP